MELQIKLVLPCRNGNLSGWRVGGIVVAAGDPLIIPGLGLRRDFLLHVGEEGARGCEAHGGRNSIRLHPCRRLIEHGAGGAAAVVAHTVEIHHFIQAGRVLSRLLEVRREAHRIEACIRVSVWKIRQHLAAVRRLPPEELQRQRIGFVPRHLLGHKIVDPRQAVDLRQLPVVAEGVRVPSNAHIHAVILPVPAFANEYGARDGFAVGHIQVRFHPHAADNLPPALLDSLLDLLIDLWIFVGQPSVILRGRLGKCVGEILVHQLQRSGERALHHVDGLGPRPEPGCINVRITGLKKSRLFEQRTQRFKARLRGAQRGIKSRLI